MEDDLRYYLKLHQEAFTILGGPDSVLELATPLEPKEKLKNAYKFMKEAKIRGQNIDFGTFKLIKKYSSTFDE